MAIGGEDSPHHATPADAAGTGDSSRHSVQASDAAAPIGLNASESAGSASGRTSTFRTVWNPRMVDVPGWGTVAIDVVAMGTAALRDQHDRAITLLLATPPPRSRCDCSQRMLRRSRCRR